ncbi:hypothetical protein [Synechococcus sp. LTW-R]|uniref:hypothetical protein n=1 Tax=Synechococcus sp. LTW-R TaxID=2751170 RepID=UPI0016241433|nr:hypothetical protein [Synechococcus sp. LTW-R]QNG28557.1 hypothetical protein H0O22_07090 [Synechococcus sp. LTW-R]
MFQRAETLRQGWIADHVARTAFGLSNAEWKRAAELMDADGAIRCPRKGWPVEALGLAVRRIKLERGL